MFGFLLTILDPYVCIEKALFNKISHKSRAYNQFFAKMTKTGNDPRSKRLE